MKPKKNNLIRGAYHFFSPNIKAEKQFNLFKNEVNLQKGDLPPILDVELIKCDINEVNKWIIMCKNHFGVEPILYTYYLYFKFFLEFRIEKCKLWIYTNEKINFAPSFNNYKCVIWQYSQKGNINGIKGPVDEDLFLIDSNQINELLIK
ncbi:MAG: glycoside hydrolase family 25 protein [Bacteroidota bacterium]